MSSKERHQLELNFRQNVLEVFSIDSIALFTCRHEAVSRSFVAQIDDPLLFSDPNHCTEMLFPSQTVCQLVHPPAKRWSLVERGLSVGIDLMRRVKIPRTSGSRLSALSLDSPVLALGVQRFSTCRPHSTDSLSPAPPLPSDVKNWRYSVCVSPK